MYVTDKKFEEGMSEINQRLDGIETEVSRMYPFIREVGDNLYHRFSEDMQRYIGALAEDYQSKLQTVGEKTSLIWEKCERKHDEFEKRLDAKSF